MSTGGYVTSPTRLRPSHPGRGQSRQACVRRSRRVPAPPAGVSPATGTDPGRPSHRHTVDRRSHRGTPIRPRTGHDGSSRRVRRPAGRTASSRPAESRGSGRRSSTRRRLAGHRPSGSPSAGAGTGKTARGGTVVRRSTRRRSLANRETSCFRRPSDSHRDARSSTGVGRRSRDWLVPSGPVRRPDGARSGRRTRARTSTLRSSGPFAPHPGVCP